MNTGKLSFNFPARLQGQIALLVWGVIAVLLLRHDIYGLDEPAARSLLLSWSIADQVANSVPTFGMPDLRILPFLPVGFLWTGSVFAAKVFTVMLLALSGWLLFDWKSRISGSESALLATGLLIISPLALAQIDSISAGVYLLASFALGSWLDVQFRGNPRPFNGWFFAQIFLCAFSVSLHPAGLAYPLALILSLRSLPMTPKYQKFFLGGIVLVVSFFLIPKYLFSVHLLWNDLTWLRNPLKNLGTIFSGSSLDEADPFMQWVPGGIVLALAVAIALFNFRKLWQDLAGRSLLIGSLLGLLVGDRAWALVVLALVLYFGIPLLLRPGQAPNEGGFMKQRGWVLLAVFICSTIFMRADKGFYEEAHAGSLSAQDELIKTLALAAENERKASESDESGKSHPRLNVASEWPGRTMLACKCDTFPLPPVEKDPQTQLAKLHTITFVLFDPKRTANVDLARNFSLLGGEVETVSLQLGGVLLHVKEEAAAEPKEAEPKTSGPGTSKPDATHAEKGTQL